MANTPSKRSTASEWTRTISTSKFWVGVDRTVFEPCLFAAYWTYSIYKPSEPIPAPPAFEKEPGSHVYPEGEMVRLKAFLSGAAPFQYKLSINGQVNKHA